MPKFSIIVNCFNGEKYLREALDSIYKQTNQDWEIIFWDNKSTDLSSQIAKGYDSKLKYFLAETKTTLSEARQLAVEQSSGEWIAFLDTDDYWYKKKLETQLTKVTNTDYIVCYGGVDEIDEGGNRLRSLVPKYKDGNQLSNHLKQFDINMVTPIIRREALINHKIKFDKNIVASEEYNIFLKLACVGEFCSIKRVLGVWRIRKKSLTSESSEFWAKDRRITLQALVNYNHSIETDYKMELKAAYTTSDYYEARHFFNTGNKEKGIKLMKGISSYSYVFFILWILSYSSFIWDLIHKESIKRYLSAYILGFSSIEKSKRNNN